MRNREYSERLAIAAEQNRKEKEFWNTQLAGEPVKTPFPYDFKYGLKSASMETIDFLLTGEKDNRLLSRLSVITKGSDYTLNLVLIGGIVLLLNKYTESSDILLGMPIYKQEIEGDYINTVVILRNRLETDMTFKELLLQVKKTITDSIENQNYPLEILADKLTIENKETGFPPFDVAIMLENIHKKEYLDHIDCSVTIVFKKQEDRISGAVKYNRSLYKRKSIERVIAHFTHLLQQVLSDVDMSLSAVDLVTEAEKKELLVDFNNTKTETRWEKNIYQRFREQVEKTPEKTAVVGINTSQNPQALTYRQLYMKTLQVRAVLRAKGAARGRIIGLLLERSVDIPGAIFGILAADCTYMPIDPEFPPGRIEYMLIDSNAAALVTARELFEKIERIKSWESKTIFLDWNHPPDNGVNEVPFNSLPTPGFAYTIYTSGTTGKPKGVLLTQKSLANYVEWFTQTTALSENDNTILTSSFAFDLGYTSFYPSLLKGCELHIVPREIYLLGEQLLKYIKEKGITYLKVTPSLFSVIIKTPGFSTEACPTLRLIVIGGEAIHVADIEKAHHLYPQLRIMNHYGPTEATIGCVATFIDFNRFGEYKANPVIGKPIFNTKVFILGRNLNIMPSGVPGELCISGSGLACGYLNLPELTHNKFLTNPQLPAHLIRRSTIYRTGDLARWHPDGTIEFLGRIDNQVKVMGYRIELGEIQNRLQNHKDIKNAYIMVREPSETTPGSHTGDKYLCAYIVPKEGTITTPRKEAAPAHRTLLRLHDIMKAEDLTVPHDSQELGKVGFKSSLLDYFREKIEKSRDTVAVVSNDTYLTYNCLDTCARKAAKKILSEYDDRYKLSKRERTRYMRQMLLYGWGIESQEKLKSTTVFVAGAGGGASPTIIQLALAGFGTIIVCDFDLVELSNLNRQFLHDETRLNMNKALSAQMTVARVNPNVKVIPRCEKLTRENVAELVGDAAVIFDMFDGLEAKFILSEYALARGIPHVISAMTDINGYTAVFHPPKTPCYHCIFDRKKWETIVAGMSNYVEEYEKNPLPVVATSLFMSTAFAVNEVIKVVLGLGTPAYNKFIFFNQRGSEELADTPSFQATTHAFSEHFRKISKEQGFDWEIGWRGNFLEEITINPDPYCPFCGTKSNDYPQNQPKELKTPTDVPLYNSNNTPDDPEVKRETIALLLETDTYKAAGFLGAVISGKTYVPLDPDFSIERLSVVLKDSEARLILTDIHYLELAEKIRQKTNKNIKIVDISELCRDRTADDKTNSEIPGREIPVQQTAYMLYPPEPPAKNAAEEIITESYADILHFYNVFNYNMQENSNPTKTAKSIISGNYTLKAAMIDFYTTLLNGGTPYTFEKQRKTESPADFFQRLREYLRKELPDYMIPSYFVLLDKIPQTPNGKVDQKALPEPRPNEEDIIPPGNDLERKLVGIWSQVLEIEKNRLSINSNFFELGGNSLKATVLISKMHKELDVKVPLGEIFKSPQIKSLSIFIESLDKDKFIAIEPTPVKPYYSLSSGQKRLYILQMMDETSTRYNMFRAFRMQGRIDRDKVEKIFMQLIQRHESFRTSFEMKESEPVQVIHDNVPFNLEYYDLAAMGEQGNEKKVADAFLRCFNLSKPPLLRVGLVKIEEDDFILILDLHHIISDGTSMRKLEREFRVLYAGGTLAPLKLQYRDFSEWQNRLFETDAIRKQKEYWYNRFKGDIPVLKMPHDYPRPSVLTGEGESIRFEIDRDTTQNLKHLVSETETTMFMVLMTVFNILLSKYSGQEDIVVGTPIIGRRHVDLENIIGIFVNMLALRNHPKKEKTFTEFLDEVKTNAFDANENQDYQFEQLVWDLNLKADYGRYPLFDAVFVLDVDEVKKVDVAAEDDFGKLKISHFLVKMEKLHHEFLLNASEHANMIFMELQYSTQLYKEATVQKMINHYLEILDQIIESRYIKIKDIKISHELIAAASDTARDEQEDFRL